jgi:hypothetical protein
MDLTKYKDALGLPGQGFHKHVMGIALGDTIGTLLICYAISVWFNISFLKTLVVAFVLGELAHYVFGVKSAVLKFIGL